MTEEVDLGLDTLLTVRLDLASDVSRSLLEDCFEIQKKYQFEHDRAISTKAMDRLIDSYVDRATSDEQQDRS